MEMEELYNMDGSTEKCKHENFSFDGEFLDCNDCDKEFSLEDWKAMGRVVVRPKTTQAVIDGFSKLLDAQDNKGIKKYGTTIDEAEDKNYDWRIMALEETADLQKYLVKEINKLMAEVIRENERANENYMALMEVERDRDKWKKQYIKAHAEIQDLQYKIKVAESEKETAKLKIGEKNKHITELTQIRSDLEQQIFDLKNEKAHECHKNQAIHWQGKDIVKVKCQICDKTLYQA
jgi:chromosome segregation ATPase